MSRQPSADAAVSAKRLVSLRASSLLAGISAAQLDVVTAQVRDCRPRAGETFIREDETGDSLYIVAAGRVEVFGRESAGDDPAIEVVEAGDCVGEVAFLERDRIRTASARALEDAYLLRLDYADLWRLIEAAPVVLKNLTEIVSTRLRRSNHRFQETALKARQFERSFATLRSFVDLSEIWTLQVGIEGLIERVVHAAGKMMDAERATLFLLDPLSGELWSMVAEGEERHEIRTPATAGLAGWVVQNDAWLNIPDAYADPRFNPEVDLRTGYRTRSVLCGPVKNLQGESIGAIQVINKRVGAFDPSDELLFRALASQTAIAVENFQLYQRMVSSQEKVMTLLDVAVAVSQTLDLETLMGKIVAKISEVLHAERSSLFLIDPETDELWAREAEGEGVSEIRFPRTRGLAGHVATTGETINIRDAYADPRFNRSFDAKTGFHTRSILCAPVRNRDGQIIGVTQTINKRGRPFETEDEELLRALSSQIAVALENAQLYARALDMKNYLESVQESISNSILTLDGAHRVVTANHAAHELMRPAETRWSSATSATCSAPPTRLWSGRSTRCTPRGAPWWTTTASSCTRTASAARSTSTFSPWSITPASTRGRS